MSNITPVAPFICIAWERDLDDENSDERWNSGMQLVFAANTERARDQFIEAVATDDDSPPVARLEVRVKPF